MFPELCTTTYEVEEAALPTPIKISAPLFSITPNNGSSTSPTHTHLTPSSSPTTQNQTLKKIQFTTSFSHQIRRYIPSGGAPVYLIQDPIKNMRSPNCQSTTGGLCCWIAVIVGDFTEHNRISHKHVREE